MNMGFWFKKKVAMRWGEYFLVTYKRCAIEVGVGGTLGCRDTFVAGDGRPPGSAQLRSSAQMDSPEMMARILSRSKLATWSSWSWGNGDRRCHQIAGWLVSDYIAGISALISSHLLFIFPAFRSF